MTPQASRLLRRINGLGTPLNVKWLSKDLGIPVPSIRRCLNELNWRVISGYYWEIQKGVIIQWEM